MYNSNLGSFFCGVFVCLCACFSAALITSLELKWQQGLVSKQELHASCVQVCAGGCPCASILPVPPWDFLSLATSAFLQGRDHILFISVTYNFLHKAFPSFLSYFSTYPVPFCRSPWGMDQAWRKKLELYFNQVFGDARNSLDTSKMTV